ncbi:MAG: tetratricopeptide repeat protein, partial [Myxococcota bacterium]
EAELEAQTEVEDILDSMTTRLARERNQEGIEALNTTPSNLPKALEAFQSAYAFDPEDVEIINNLGFVYSELGNLERAENFLRRAIEKSPDRLVALTNLSDVLIAVGTDPALREARKLLARARELAGNDATLIERQATVARRSSNEPEALRFYREALLAAPDDAELALTLGDYYRELARDDDAAEWYRSIDKKNELGAIARERLQQLEIERAARRYGWSPATREVKRRVRLLVRRADELLARGQLAAAEEIARTAVNEAPQYADAHRVLGDARVAQGKDALPVYLRGFVVEPNNAALIRRIGLAYREDERHAEASVLLARALQLRPDWTELRLDLALALRSSGDLPAALREATRFLENGDAIPRRQEAQRLKDELSALQKPDEREPATETRDIAACLNRARVLLSRGRADAALATLDCGDEPEVRRLRARILIASGRTEAGRTLLQSTVAAHRTDPDAHYELGLLHREAGDFDAAWKSFSAAEELGMHDATYQLGEIDFEAGAPSAWPWPRSIERLLRARTRFQNYVERSGGPFVDVAHTRLDRIAEIRSNFIRAGAVGLSMLVLLIALGVWRRRSGFDLATFLRARPEAGAEAQSVLAAIRHEVLKHNTTALEGLLASLQRLDDVGEDLQRFERALFEDQGSVARKLDRYVDDLERIARRHDARLNLRRRDAVIGALLEGFAILERARPTLANPPRNERQRKSLIRTLDRASRRLNDQAYRAVLDLLRELRELEVTEALLRSVGRRVASEPSVHGKATTELEILGGDVLPCAALVPRTLFDDILTNLLRNAFQAALAEHTNAARVAIEAATTVDDLTGVSYLTLTVFDEVPRIIERHQIESASVESGLGIVRDAASRCDGMVFSVPGKAGYQKGIAISFVLAESEVTADEWELAS